MIIVALALLGVVLGSFVNALVWRLHEQATIRKKKGGRSLPTQAANNLSIIKGRSMCPHCRHTLAAKDLVPVLSWLWLRGRCRYCHRTISRQYPAVELLTGLLLALGYAAWPAFDAAGVIRFGFFVVFTVFFVALALYDTKWFLLPNKLVFPLIGLAATQVALLAIWQRSFGDAWQPVAGAAVIYGLFWGLYKVSKGQWIGGGDVKLVIALGLIAGSPVRALLVVFCASLLGTFASFPLLLKGRKGMTQHIPFGPYLLAGCFLVVLFAGNVIDWYQQLLSLTY
jgi:leader peptidase (prepilin peptidase)/N-methyltransferase